MSNLDRHLDLYSDKSELVENDEVTSVFEEGPQSYVAKNRYRIIKKSLEDGYLENLDISVDLNISDKELSEYDRKMIVSLVDEITSEKGRAMIVLLFIQLTVKAICPEQSVRLHKANNGNNQFSWKEGISMRTIDSNFVTPFLRDKRLLNLNKYGAFMTRSLSENYPYTSFYKASIRGEANAWKKLTDRIESQKFSSRKALIYLISLLKNRSQEFTATADRVIGEAEAYASNTNYKDIGSLLKKLVENSDYSARIFEIVMHSLMQVLQSKNELSGKLQPMTQMRSANKKHGNIGDIEVIDSDGHIIESWDAKYGKPYLRDELEELDDKLQNQQSVEQVGFVTNGSVDKRKDIINRKKELEESYKVDIQLLSFDEWVQLKMQNLELNERKTICKKWLVVVAESLGQKRRDLAPIDEPTEVWLKTLEKELLK